MTPPAIRAIAGFCQPPEMPGTPNVSWGAEAFLDTMMVNGTVYPTLTVEPQTYRFRILNAAHDRFLNLQLYKASPIVSSHHRHQRGQRLYLRSCCHHHGWTARAPPLRQPWI